MAILEPDQMDFSGKKFSMIIAGAPGSGKTTLAMSAPSPILVDLDKGVSRIKAMHRRTTIVCDNYEELLQDIQSDAVKRAETIVIDTGGSLVTYLQDWAMRDNPSLNRQKNGAISLKGFGAVKNEFTRFTNMLQYIMDKNIIYIFHTVEEKDGDVVKQRLMCEGAARNIVWQPCDLGCQLQIIGEKRYMGFGPDEHYFAKRCFGIRGLVEIPSLDDGGKNDILTRLFTQARENIAEEAAAYKAEEPAYLAAIEAGRAIVAGVVDAETAQAAGPHIKQLSHALTSEKEIRAMLSARIKELGLKWDKGAGAYVSAE